jgi:membrane protein YqaA with SNARE-associated domain
MMMHADGRSVAGSRPRHSPACFAAWERWSATTGAGWLQFTWAFAEATFWPILPDFLLVPLALGTPRHARRLLLCAITGMALGGSGLYLFAYRQPAAAMHLLQQLPTVRAGARDRARDDLAAHGLAAFLFQPVSGVPFKVWALLAGSQGRSPLQAIPLFVLARSARMAILTLAASLIGVRCRPFLSRHFLVLMTLYLGGFLYVWWRLVS